MRSNTARYGLPLILIHWVAALIILFLFGLGGYLKYGPPNSPSYGFLLDLYTSLGLTVALLVLLLLCLRVALRRPALPDGFPLWQKRLAGALIVLLYIAFALILVGGYLQLVFSASPIQFWGIALPARGVADENLAGFFGSIHAGAVWLLAGLILVHVGMVVLNLFKRPEFAARMLPLGAPEPSEPLAEPVLHAGHALAAGLAKNMRLLGWIEFWFQFVLAFTSGLLLAFASSGRAFSPGSVGFGDALHWSGYGFLLLCLAVVLAVYYTRAARRLVLYPDAYFRPDRKFAFWFLGTGMLTGLLGMLISFTGVALSISLLIAKTISQPAGIAITDPNKIIRALDVFILLVNFNLLMAHFIGTGVSLWLIIRAAKARQEYQPFAAQLAEAESA